MDAKEDFPMIPLGLTFLVFSALVGCVYLRDRAKRRREDLATADAIIESWKPRRHDYRRHGRFARRPYASWPVPQIDFPETNPQLLRITNRRNPHE